MDKNIEITIQAVGNGFLVRPYTAPNQLASMEEIVVFQTMSELLSFVQAHFDHRCGSVQVDAQAKEAA
jgi:hypothetical protein